MPLSLVFLLPLVQMLLASFTSNADINRFPPRFFPSALHISGYVRLFRDAPVARWMLNSAIVSGIAIVATWSCARSAATPMPGCRSGDGPWRS